MILLLFVFCCIYACYLLHFALIIVAEEQNARQDKALQEMARMQGALNVECLSK